MCTSKYSGEGLDEDGEELEEFEYCLNLYLESAQMRCTDHSMGGRDTDLMQSGQAMRTARGAAAAQPPLFESCDCKNKIMRKW